MKHYFILLGMAFCMTQGHAQNHQTKTQQSVFDQFLHSATAEFDDFSQQSEREFETFRRKMMQEFIGFVRQPWKEFQETPPVPMPKDDEVPPVVMPRDDEGKAHEDRPVRIDTVIAPQPVEPQPTPVVPIEEVPVAEEKTLDFVFFGTPATVRFDTAHRIRLNGIDENSIADALGRINPTDYDNMMIDCLALRDRLQLSDWGYIQMLKALCDKIEGNGTNESALLLAYVYMQSGYKMRLATRGSKLYMLYASKYQIFNQSSFGVGGDVYYGVEDLPTSLHICQAAFPKEKSLSLMINGRQLFAENASEPRTIRSERYPDITITCSVNKNLIDFYNTYPTSMTGDDFMTRWALYANTPLGAKVQSQIYPTMRERLKGLTQLDAANRLLNLVQTGLAYEYDNKVWGRDRAFFSEESLFYPFCDCEDRSILFTRLVRDLLGLDCILIYYPGHLAAAVAFTEEVRGDYLLVGGKKFVVADPTFINAAVGSTMPGMDNQSASVIILSAR